MENGSQQYELTSVSHQPTITDEELRQQRRILAGIIVAVIIIVVLMIASTIYLLNPGTDTERIRDVFIIFMALESMFLGFILVILIIQLARLINLLQNEIGPILNSTNETVNTLRGTSQFLSENLVEPVIKMNEYSAGILRLLSIIGISKKTK